MAEQRSLPHRVSLNERKMLSVTGVTEVVSFDEEAVVMHTGLGTLVVQGRELKLKNLSPEGGQMEVSGSIDALSYQQLKQQGSWLRRLFG